MARNPPRRSRLPRILAVSRRGPTRFALAFGGFANFYLAGLHVVENLDPHRSKWLHATTPDCSSRATERNGLLSAGTETPECPDDSAARDRNERPAVSWVSMKVAAGDDDAGYPLELELAIELVRGSSNARFWALAAIGGASRK